MVNHAPSHPLTPEYPPIASVRDESRVGFGSPIQFQRLRRRDLVFYNQKGYNKEKCDKVGSVLAEVEADIVESLDLVPVVDLKGRPLSPCTPEKVEQNLRDGLAHLEDGVLHLNYRPMAYRAVYRAVRQRDGLRCAWCHGVGSTLEHVIPVCWGGLTTLDNCVIACRACNHSRNNALPDQFIAWTGFRPTHPVILRILKDQGKALQRAHDALARKPITACTSKEEAQVWVAFQARQLDRVRPAPPSLPQSRFKPDVKPFFDVFLP